jgi:CRP/FNR family transcriptional regulator, anaerobic regulatory protein
LEVILQRFSGLWGAAPAVDSVRLPNFRHGNIEMNANTCRSPCSTCTLDSAICSALSLGSSDSSELKQSLRQVHRTARGGRDIYCAGETATDAHIICEGWAARVGEMADGRRQIVSFLLPGDLVSAAASLDVSMDLSVEAITELRYSLISRTKLLAALSEQSDLFEIWGGLHAAEMQAAQELIVNIRRSPDARVARLILHLSERLAARGLVNDGSFAFPLDEDHVADALGLAASDVAAVFDRFRAAGIFALSESRMKILDPAGLAHQAG